MYQTKTTGFLELLMNALSFPVPRRSAPVRRVRTVPTRREAAVAASVRDAAAKESYIATARVLWWNR